MNRLYNIIMSVVLKQLSSYRFNCFLNGQGHFSRGLLLLFRPLINLRDTHFRQLGTVIYLVHLLHVKGFSCLCQKSLALVLAGLALATDCYERWWVCGCALNTVDRGSCLSKTC